MGDFSGKRASYACCNAAFAGWEGVEMVRLGGIPRRRGRGPLSMKLPLWGRWLAQRDSPTQSLPPWGRWLAQRDGGGPQQKKPLQRPRAIARSLARPPPTHLRRATSPSGGDSFLALASFADAASIKRQFDLFHDPVSLGQDFDDLLIVTDVVP